ncbi:MAG: hypothetical protein HYS04_19310 [Acidobacteria bacterium]|nr:hypothetical protein [Acidobacteriota bacterium]
MILPTQHTTAVLLALVTLLCWGSWASTLKATRKWRFELFYFDFVIGLVLMAVVSAYTFGSMGDELSFGDNLLITGKRQIAWGLAAGLVFNLGNMLLLSAVSLAGMAVAFPISMGLAFALGAVVRYIMTSRGNPLLLFAGAGLAAAAVVVAIFAHRIAAEEEGELTDRFSIKAIILALAGGLVLVAYPPLAETARFGDIGLGPFTLVFMMAMSAFASTFVYNLYFMNLPVQGEPVGFSDYFASGSLRNHLLGIVGGMLWAAAAVCYYVLLVTPAPAGVSPAISFGAADGASVVAILWGLLYWREFGGAEIRAKLLAAIMVVLYAAAVALTAMAPVYER